MKLTVAKVSELKPGDVFLWSYKPMSWSPVTEGLLKGLQYNPSALVIKNEETDYTDEQIARAFHDSYERQAPEHGYETRKDSAVAWDDVPEKNRKLMIATVSDLRSRGII